MADQNTLGHFIEYSLFEQAEKIIDAQIKSRSRSYRTINFHYFKRIDLSNFSICDCYKQKVSNNLFYFLSNEFYVMDYQIPKGIFGLRNYCFFSYPMFLLYYSIGLYIVKVSENIIDYLKIDSDIYVYYGSKICFKNKNEVIINNKTLDYYSHYRDFKNKLKSLSRPTDSFSKKIIISLDIQNYFENIDISLLLEFIDKYSSPSIKKQNKFDASTKESILFFFKYLMNGKNGIPQSDKNLLSSFIANLYLVNFDLTASDYLKNLNLSFSYLRYVDDIYIIMDVPSNFLDSKIKDIMEELESILYSTSKLRLSFSKSNSYVLTDLSSWKSFCKKIKKASGGDDFYDPYDEKVNIQKKSDRLLEVLDKVCNLHQYIDEEYYSLSFKVDNKDSESIKYVFDGRNRIMDFIMAKEDYRNRLYKILKDIDFKYTLINVKAFLLLIFCFEDIRDNFIVYLKSIKKINLFHLSLIEALLLQENKYIHDKGFLNIIKGNSHINTRRILYYAFYKVVEIDSRLIVNEKIKLDFDYDILSKGFIDQARYMNYSEKIEDFSSALNHLLNVIHCLCYDLEGRKTKDYKSHQVSVFLKTKKIDKKDILIIESLFNRRNNNIKSHPGFGDHISWPVIRNEYYFYKKSVNRVIFRLFKIYGCKS